MKITKKLFVAIMTMALLVITFGTTTFAWFTLGTENKVDGINVNVTTGNGMEISLDGNAWKNNLHLAANDKEFKDLTSADGYAIKTMTDLAADTDNYLTVTFYLRITKDSTGAADFNQVYLASVKGEHGTDDDVNWVADVDFGSYTKGTSYVWDALNALKMGFTANTESSARLVYAYENDDDLGISRGPAELAGLAKAYADVKEYDISSAPTTLPTYIVKANLGEDTSKILDKNDFGATADGLTGTLDDRYLYAKVTLKVWLEGWDADCINAILAQTAKLSFVLKAK